MSQQNLYGSMVINGQSVPVDVTVDMPHVPLTEVAANELFNRIRALESWRQNQGALGSNMRSTTHDLVALIQAVQRGQMIAAIKALRSATPGLGLKEAKELVQGVWITELAKAAELEHMRGQYGV